jgi:predicted Ser/Thr protein kinase
VRTKSDVLPPRYRSPITIGRGGMGDIYRATDEVLGRAVAVKVLAEQYAQDEDCRARFTREALTAARLSAEPNTVTIFDVGEHDGRPFIVMEYLSGGSLETKLREGPVPVGQALEWLEQTAAALDAAHRHGIVHRDVKPANLLLSRDGEIHVSDFGIASVAGLESVTLTGTVLGTAGYLSPEQADARQATAASDRYSLAVVAFELLTGSRPFEADSITAEALAHVRAPVPSACGRNPRLPCSLDAVFERALAKDPEERYPTCGELVADLRAAIAEAEPKTAVLSPLIGPAARRRRSAWPLATLMALLALAGLAAALLLTGRSSEQTVSTVVRTVTTKAPGQVRTVTTTATTATTPQTQPTAPPAAQTGQQLNDAGFAKMQAGDYEGALPLLEQAVSQLSGTGSIAEAYAGYNLAFTRFALGRCEGVTDLLSRSEQIQGRRKEIDRLRKQAEHRC